MMYIVFLFIWTVCVLAIQGLLINAKETYAQVLEKNKDAFPECTNCVRYFDTVICKCKTSEDPQPVAFLYPTDITPDINLGEISSAQRPA